MTRASVILAAVAVCAVILSGCTLTRPVEDRTQFYVLKSVDSGAGDRDIGSANEGSGNAVVVGLRRLRLADYFNVPTLTIRTGENSLRYAAHHRWAEAIDRGTARILRETLRGDPGISAVFFFPEASREPVDFEIEVSLLAFEMIDEEGEPGRYVIEAVWNVFEAEGRSVIASGDFSREGSWERGDYAAFARAASVACSELGREIAADLEGVENRP